MDENRRQGHDDINVRNYNLEKRLSANIKEKYCRGCSITKPHSCFYKSKSHWDGVRHQCKKCISKQQNKKNKEPEVQQRKKDIRVSRRVVGIRKCDLEMVIGKIIEGDSSGAISFIKERIEKTSKDEANE